MYSGPWRTVPRCTNHVDRTPAKEDLGQLSPKHLTPAIRAAHGTGGHSEDEAARTSPRGLGVYSGLTRPFSPRASEFLGRQRRGKVGGTRQHWERDAGDREGTGDVCRERSPLTGTERVIACLEGRKDLLLFLFLKAEEVEAVHMYIPAHKFFHSRRNKHTEFSAVAICHTKYICIFLQGAKPSYFM